MNSYVGLVSEDFLILCFTGLSLFNATIFKKFGANVDPSTVLQFISHRLKNFRSADLIILRELIAKTTNIRPQANLSDDQVVSMAGGPALRTEVLAADTRGSLSTSFISTNENGTRRLLAGLRKADLLVPMLILTAQQREFCVEKVDRSEEHLKHISNLFDEVCCMHMCFPPCQCLTKLFLSAKPYCFSTLTL